MANDNKPEIVLGADISPLRAAMREAADKFKETAAIGEGAFNRLMGPIGSLQGMFLRLGGLLAGGSMFKAAVDDSVDLHKEVLKLSGMLGISEQRAIGLRYALGDLYIDTDTFHAAIGKLTIGLQDGGDKFEKLGIKVHDSHGRLLDMMTIMANANEWILKHAEGTDRAAASALVYGKNWQEVGRVLQVTNTAIDAGIQKARELGVEINKQNYQEYRAAMNDAGDVTEALSVRLGSTLMPFLTQLASAFAGLAPLIDLVVFALKAVLTVADTGLTGLMQILVSLKGVANEVWIALRMIGLASFEALKGNGAGMREEWQRGLDDLRASQVRTTEELSSLGENYAKRVRAAWSSGSTTSTSQPQPSGAGFKGDPTSQSAKTQMPEFEAQLAAKRNAYEQGNALRQFDKEQELAYWRDVLANVRLSAQDRLSITRKTSDLERDIRRQAAKDQQELDLFGIEAKRNAESAQIELERQSAKFARENGELSKRELIQLEEEFTRRKFEIDTQAAKDRLTLMENDPSQSPAALARQKEELLQIERQYRMQQAQLGQDKNDVGSLGDVLKDSETAVSQFSTNMITKFNSLRGQLNNMFISIGTSFVRNVVSEPAAKWLAGMARMLAQKMGFMGMEQAAEKTASDATVTTKTKEASSVVSANAAEGASGAAASVASIPYAGPILAIAAFAATMSMIMGAMGSIKSASKGFNIPKGLNPMTQLHEEEMVLPSKYANVIRSLAEGQGGSGGGTVINHNYHIAPKTLGPSDSAREIVRVLKDLERRNVKK